MTYSSLLRVREFRYLHAAYTLSLLGDQLAAVAVAVLVYDQTGSELATAAAYASGWLPGVVGGPFLSGLADRLPRRAVMIVCDVARALIVAALVLPGLPLGTAIGLLFVANLFASPFSAARSALMPDVLEGEAYITGNGLGNITFQVCQIAGFAAGGVAVGLLTPHGSLMVNAATFLASGLLIYVGVRPRPAVAAAHRNLISDMVEGIRYVFGQPWLRGCLLTVWIASAFTFGPEALAYPYARELGGGAKAAGLLLAAPAAGFTIGALLLTRVWQGIARDRLLLPAALIGTGALIPALLNPPLPVVLGLFFLAGVGASFSAPLNAIFARRVDTEHRGRAMGVAISGLMAVQGLAFVTVGAVANAGVPSAVVVGVSGLLGTGFVALAWSRWRRSGPVRSRVLALSRSDEVV